MLFGHDSEEAHAHADVTGGHTAQLSHELIAAAASYEAAKAYENHLRAHGKPAEHAKAIELLAAFAGGYIDKIAETKGLDALDKERVKRDARQRTNTALEQSGY